jgi:hypothetical protein
LSRASDHVSVRLEDPVVERADDLAALMTPIGTKVNRSVALRACILIGLPVLEKQYGIKAPELSEPVADEEQVTT